MKTKWILIFILLLSFEAKSQKQKFSNYHKIEKEIVVLDIGYVIDSIETVSIPKNKISAVYSFLESEIANFHKGLNVDFDSPFRLTLRKNDKTGGKKWETELSKFSHSNMWIKTMQWPDKILELSNNEIDFTKQIFVEIGPSLEFYKFLLEEPTNVEYAREIALSTQDRIDSSNRIFRSPNNALSPVYPGGFKKLNEYLYTQLVQPIMKENSKLHGSNLVYWLTIENDGSISDVETSSNANFKQKELTINIVDHLYKLPKWIPANRNGKSVRSKYELQLRIKPFFYENIISVSGLPASATPKEYKPIIDIPENPIEVEDELIFKFVEKMPTFPGCENLDGSEMKRCSKEKLDAYIKDNLVYPVSKDTELSGTAIVQFVVNKDGTLRDIRVLRDPGNGCGKAASDVFTKMNSKSIIWNPGKQRGRKVNVQYTVPVKFVN